MLKCPGLFFYTISIEKEAGTLCMEKAEFITENAENSEEDYWGLISCWFYPFC